MELQSDSESVNIAATLSHPPTNSHRNFKASNENCLDKSNYISNSDTKTKDCDGSREDINSAFNNSSSFQTSASTSTEIPKEPNLLTSSTSRTGYEKSTAVDQSSDSISPNSSFESIKNNLSTPEESEELPSNKMNCSPKEPQSSEHFNDSNEHNGSCIGKDKSSSDVIRQEDISDPPAAEFSEDSSSQDMRRTRRNSKRKRESEEFCPVCGITIRMPELRSHFAKEIENLSKISRNIKKQRRDERTLNKTFAQVKTNRENRLTAKVAKYAARARSEVQCPICKLRISGTPDEVNRHVVNCINQDENSDELLVVDDDDDESFEEYEFANQTRVRAISFVPGGYKTLQGQSAQHKPTDDDEDLNVDVDDTLTYGQPQYTELDVIPNTTDDEENKELEQLRKAVLTDPTAQPHILESRKWCSLEEMKKENADQSVSSNENSVDTKILNGVENQNEKNSQSNHVVSSLREKIKDLEEQNKNVKCLICMEPYTKPVVSTTCWHVYCEECWLMTMGVKKLCPQCNMIVFPSDLRRIYL